MESHLYLSVMPEALIASQLDPEQFGAYYATGSQKKSRSMAMFFELDLDYRHEYFDMEAGFGRLVPHEDGSPKRSVYISVYRVIEHVAPNAVKRMYLTTADGRTLGLDAAQDIPTRAEGLHLYQEIAPVHPRVVSSLCPADFYDFLYDPAKSMVTVPALSWALVTWGALLAGSRLLFSASMVTQLLAAGMGCPVSSTRLMVMLNVDGGPTNASAGTVIWYTAPCCTSTTACWPVMSMWSRADAVMVVKPGDVR